MKNIKNYKHKRPLKIVTRNDNKNILIIDEL